MSKSRVYTAFYKQELTPIVTRASEDVLHGNVTGSSPRWSDLVKVWKPELAFIPCSGMQLRSGPGSTLAKLST